MQKKLLSLIALILLAVSLSLLIGCSSNEKKLYFHSVYTQIKNCETNEYCDDSQLAAGVKYIMEIDFELSSSQNIKKDTYFNTVIRFMNSDILSPKIIQSNMESIQEQTAQDEILGSYYEFVLSDLIPKTANTVKYFHIEVELNTNWIENEEETFKLYSTVEINFETNESDKFIFDGEGKDGFATILCIVRTQLENPVLVVDPTGADLTWHHVEHATQYDIYAIGQKIATFSVTDMGVGEKITYTSSQLNEAFSQAGLTSSEYIITIKALGNNNYLNSRSNDVTYNYVAS